MNNTLGRGFVDDRHGLRQVFFGLICRVIGDRCSDFFNGVLDPSLVTDIS